MVNRNQFDWYGKQSGRMHRVAAAIGDIAKNVALNPRHTSKSSIKFQ
jgi:hypothetical protein